MKFGNRLVLLLLIAFVMAAQTAMAGTRTLYLVHHGMYDYQDDADPDVGKALIPIGAAQAKLVADRLRSLPVTMSALRSSTMTRARETAIVIGLSFPELTIEHSRLIRECIMPTWREDIMEEYADEDMDECLANVNAAFEKYFVPTPDEDLHEILVCHGNVIRYLVTKALKVDTMAWLGMTVGNCSLTVIQIKDDGAMKVLAVGDVGHIPPNLQTGLDNVERTLDIPGRDPEDDQ